MLVLTVHDNNDAPATLDDLLNFALCLLDLCLDLAPAFLLDQGLMWIYVQWIVATIHD